MHNADKVFSISDEIVTRDNQDGSVILMKMDDSEIFYKINGVAASVWKGLKEGKKVSAIKAQILSEFNVSQDQLDKDVTDLVDDLINKKIIS